MGKVKTKGLMDGFMDGFMNDDCLTRNKIFVDFQLTLKGSI